MNCGTAGLATLLGLESGIKEGEGFALTVRDTHYFVPRRVYACGLGACQNQCPLQARTVQGSSLARSLEKGEERESRKRESAS